MKMRVNNKIHITVPNICPILNNERRESVLIHCILLIQDKYITKCIFTKVPSCDRSKTSSWVKGRSYLPQACFSNCSFSRLQGLTEAGGHGAQVRQTTGTPPPQILTFALVCRAHGVTLLHFLLPPSPLELCALHFSLFVSPGMKRIELHPHMTLLYTGLQSQHDQAATGFSCLI